MRRLHVISDLHCDIELNSVDRDAFADVDADVTICAGDLRAPGTHALRKLRDLFPDPSRPLVYVAGNHDFYSEHSNRYPGLKTTWQRQRAEMPIVAQDLGITFLDDAVAVIDGVRFVGATLWSDFSARPAYVSFEDAVREASSSRGMNDYRLVKVEPGRSRDTLRPRDTINAHKSSRKFIETTLNEPFDGETVVVTHHAPSYRSLIQQGKNFADMDWCYASNVEQLMVGDSAPALWIHGHVHRNQDYTIGDTRIVANPRGYPTREGRENPDFDPAFTVEIGPRLTPGMRI